MYDLLSKEELESEINYLSEGINGLCEEVDECRLTLKELVTELERRTRQKAM